MSPAGSSSSTAAYGIPWRGNYSSWLEQKQERLRKEEKTESKRLQTLEARIGMDPHVTARAPGQRQSACHCLRTLLEQRVRKAPRRPGNLHSPGPAPGQCRHRISTGVSKAYGDLLLIDN
jgi:energy-dependent translational throttle protein EttA